MKVPALVTDMTIFIIQNRFHINQITLLKKFISPQYQFQYLFPPLTVWH